MILVVNGVVIAKFDSYEQRENGKLINGAIYPIGDVIDVDAPDYVVPQKYCYDPEQGFYLNPNYREPIETELEQRIADLEAAIAAILGGAV